MVDAPQTRRCDVQRQGSLVLAGSELDFPRLGGGGHGPIRTHTLCLDAHAPRFLAHVLQVDVVGDRCRPGLHRAADALAAYQNLVAHREPDVAHDAAVVPPVVPDVGDEPHRPARNRGKAGTVIDLDRQEIARARRRRDVEEVLRVAALVLSQLHAVQPHAGFVERGSEVNLEVLGEQRSGDLECLEVPGDAFVIVVGADVPGVRDGDGLGLGGQGLRPLRSWPFLRRMGSKAPVVVQADAGGGLRHGAEEKAGQQREFGHRVPRGGSAPSRSRFEKLDGGGSGDPLQDWSPAPRHLAEVYGATHELMVVRRARRRRHWAGRVPPPSRPHT